MAAETPNDIVIIGSAPVALRAVFCFLWPRSQVYSIQCLHSFLFIIFTYMGV